MKKILFAFLLTAISGVVSAKDYVIVNPNTVGSSSDITARVLAEAYHRRTGNNLIIQSVGGGNQVPAVVHFKQLSKPGIIMTTTSILVFNHKILKNLPYTNADFDAVGPIAMSPIVWIARANSPFYTMQDIVKILPLHPKPFVAHANHVEVVNLKMLAEKYRWSKDQVQGVKYKGVPEVINGLMANDADVAVVTLTPTIAELARAGQLRVLGTTVDQELNVGGHRVPSVEKFLGVEQFTGGVFLALSPGFDPVEARQLKQDLLESLKDPKVVDSLKKRDQYIMHEDGTFLNNFINNYRKKVDPLDL